MIIYLLVVRLKCIGYVLMLEIVILIEMDTFATSADAFCINSAASFPTLASGCLYLVSDTVNKMIFNYITPYTILF
ncbi:hypothetical protein Plhal304r1_c029g0096231 [Plasmopara halstedii]